MRVLALASAAVLLPAQESARLAGPTSGIVFDAPSRALRVVMGVPGAAYLGSALAADLDGGAVSPGGRLAVAMAAGEAVLISASSGARSALGAACDGPVGWNADASAVALGCESGARLYQISADGAATELNLAGLDGKKSAIAVDAAGRAVYALRADGVYRADAESSTLLAPVAEAAGFALAGDTLYVADRAGQQVLALENLNASASTRRVVAVEEPSAVAAEGGRLFAASGSSLRVWNAGTSEELARLELDFAPTRIEALTGGLFLLHARRDDSDAVQVLDARKLTVHFVPSQDLGSVANLED
ncbi:MAG: hypothetical protein IT162_23605 [Bryobacterales bacterium]|nr:hypothetical protein [Bryobacterales bacterium]